VQCFEAGWLRGALYFVFGVVMILVAFVPDQKCITVPIFGVLLIVAAVSYMLAHLRGEIYTDNDNPAHGSVLACFQQMPQAATAARRVVWPRHF
jgi:hypothetical protein